MALIKRQELSPSEREKYLELLLLADEDEWMVRSYFEKDGCFVSRSRMKQSVLLIVYQ
jgi:hypothetical protein